MIERRAYLSERRKLAIVEAQGNRCADCRSEFRPGNPPEFDHKRALELLGTNEADNWQALCRRCHGGKTSSDHSRAHKAKNQKAACLGLREPRRPIPGSKCTPWRKKINGSVEKRGA